MPSYRTCVCVWKSKPKCASRVRILVKIIQSWVCLITAEFRSSIDNLCTYHIKLLFNVASLWHCLCPCTASVVERFVSDELGRVSADAVLAYSRKIPKIYVLGLRVTTKSSLRIANAQTEIRIGRISNCAPPPFSAWSYFCKDIPICSLIYSFVFLL